jgi:hypothetical protein
MEARVRMKQNILEVKLFNDLYICEYRTLFKYLLLLFQRRVYQGVLHEMGLLCIDDVSTDAAESQNPPIPRTASKSPKVCITY